VAQDEVEVVRAAVDALNRRDSDTFLGYLHPEVEWQESAQAFPGLAGTYRGPGEVEKWARQAVAEYWADLVMEIDEIAQGEGGIVLGVRIAARGAGSGVDTEAKAWQILELEDGLIRRRRGPFWERSEAFAASEPR
jgi:ketosteroid isomerase-like protein